MLNYVLLCLAAVGAGAVNSIAGGGTLLTFPSLLAALGSTAEAAVIANGTSTVALVPGALAAVWGYRRELRTVDRLAFVLVGPSLLGGAIGAILVTRQPPEVFQRLVPWLILAAALLFAIQPAISRRLGTAHATRGVTPRSALPICLLQLAISVYGGYFGAGAGILMLSGLAFMGLSDIHAMNSLKNLLGGIINTVAVVIFVQAGKVNWPLALMMAVAAILGGYGGARIARRLNRAFVRNLVVVIGVCLASYYFYRQATATPAAPADAASPGHAD